MAETLPAPRVVEKTILAMVDERAPRSVCPSEIARALAPDDWRPLMPVVRSAATRLWRIRAVDVTQRGEPVDPRTARGAIRLSRGYRIGRGEEGVFHYQPYKDALLPLWRFATPELARESADALYARFVAYGDAGDFAGMDMARKYLQMGMTRATRYARHAGGRKYDPRSGEELPETFDDDKARSAAIFRAAWEKAKADPTYIALRRAFRTPRG